MTGLSGRLGKNLHGHVHHKDITLGRMLDDRYINVCVEANVRRNGTVLVEWDELGIDTTEIWKNSQRERKTKNAK